MRKIDGFKELQKETGEVVEFNNLGAGPQICRILKVEDVQEKEYIKMAIDIIEGEYKDNFRQQFDNSTFEPKKWSHTATLYRSYKPTAARFFAAFITALEKSNDGYKWDWDESKFKNKKIVCNFGIEEYLSDDYDDNGNQIVKQSLKIVEVRSLEALANGDIETKEPKLLDLKQGQTREPYFKENDEDKFVRPTVQGDIKDVEDDLPF